MISTFFRKSGFTPAHAISVSGQLAGLALGFVTAVAVARGSGLEAAGYFGFYAALQQFLGFSLTFGASTFSIRVLRRSVSPERILTILVCHTGLLLILGLVLCGLYAALCTKPSDNLALVLSVIFIGMVRQMVEDVCIGLGRLALAGSIPVVENTARFVFLVGFSAGNVSDILTCLALSTMAACITPVFDLVKCKKFVLNFKLKKKYLIFIYASSLYQLFAQATGLFQSRLGILVSPVVLRPSDAGVFLLLSNLSEVTLRLGTIFSRYVIAASAQRNFGNDEPTAKKMISSVLGVGLIASVVLLVAYPFVNRWLYENQLGDYYFEFFILSSYAFVFLITNLTGSVLYGRGRARDVLVAVVGGLAVATLSMLVLSAPGSVYKLAISLLLGSVASLGLILRKI
jgi:O-antigen/teichoic acid export membrane protein